MSVGGGFDENDRAIVLGIVRWHLQTAPVNQRIGIALEAAGGSATAWGWVPEADISRFEAEGWRVRYRTPAGTGCVHRGAGAYMERGT